jgi:transcriptional regulator with XRE-family HTH domain
MMELRSYAEPVNSVGSLLQYWRKARHLSQLALANEAEISPRHLCFLETGRAKPSREMVLILASTLDIPLRERNALLLAAGFAPVYKETSLDAPELAAVRTAVDAILHQQEPFPAVVMNCYWDIITINHASERLFSHLLDDFDNKQPANMLRMIFDPHGLRPYVVGWEELAKNLVQRVYRESLYGAEDETTQQLLRDLFAYPGVPADWRKTDLEVPQLPIVPVSFQKDNQLFRFFSTVTTLGTPQDITLQEIRIECLFPVDTATDNYARQLASH